MFWGVKVRLQSEVCEDFQKRMVNKPLKFGLIRASYPDVRPMSESRKSDGDMLEDDLESCSLASTTLEHTHTHTKSLYQEEVVAEKQELKLICRLAAGW